MSFAELNLPHYLLLALDKAGYTEPTEVQKAAIPVILDGRDLIVEAETGSGKTASFALPVLKILNDALSSGESKGIHTLVLAPTRELCLQVSAFFSRYGCYLPQKFQVLSIIGGEDIDKQILALNRGTAIVVATPGRLLDLLSRQAISLSGLQFLVLDEADKILNLGFAEEVDNILKILPPKRQNVLVSATFPAKVLSLTERISRDAVHLKFTVAEPVVKNIRQRAILVNRDSRGLLLRKLIREGDWTLVLIFVASKKAAGNLARKLLNNDINAAAFHADLPQNERLTALRNFKNGKINVLIATDIAARGLDVKDVSHVINFDLPRSPEDYIHRVGRTGRAGQSGEAISFISAENREHFALIEKRAGIRLELEEIAGFEATEPVITETKGAGGIKGRRKSKKDKQRERQNRNSADEK